MSEPDESVCPHCHLPRVMPEVCTPELHEVIQAQIVRDWELFDSGYEAGKRDPYLDRAALPPEGRQAPEEVPSLKSEGAALAPPADPPPDQG